jgi:ferredoxin
MFDLRKRLSFLLIFWPLARVFNRVIRRPPFSRILHRWFSPEHNQFISIPIQHTFRGTESVVLPYELIPPILEKASTCFVMNSCLCREAEHCQKYPVSLGCLFLGDGAKRLPPSLGHRVSRERALQHVRSAVAVGLVPTVIHTLFDAFVLGLPPEQTVGICFCCECCCTVQNGLKIGPPALLQSVKRLPGLSIRVQDTCIRCGLCMAVCPVRAITPNSTKMEIGDRCMGCGQCARICPRGSITIQLEDLPQMAHTITHSIESWM